MLNKNNLTNKQQDAITALYENDELILIAPKGFGKCVVGLTAINELLEDGVLNCVLVLSTTQVCREVWQHEHENWEHIPDNLVSLAGRNEKDRIKLLASGPRIVACNFENLIWLREQDFFDNFDGLLIDEITKMKTAGGRIFQRLRNKVDKGQFVWRIGMTADPVAQERIDIYGQVRLIDKGKRLGRSQDNFRRTYFMQMDYAGHVWEPQPGGIERLTVSLSDLVYKIEDENYEESLPELHDHVIKVRLSTEVRTQYQNLVKESVLEIGDNTVVAATAGVLSGKIHQMCCGALYVENELGKRETIRIHDEKYKAFDDVFNSIVTPVLIAYQFDFQLEYLQSKYDLPVFKASNSSAYNKMLLEQWNAGELRGLLVHPKSVGHGLNLQYGPCHTLIALTYTWSADEWEQLIGRLRRRGQKAKIVDRYVIVCEDSIEDAVMARSLELRKDASEEFREYILTL